MSDDRGKAGRERQIGAINCGQQDRRGTLGAIQQQGNRGKQFVAGA